MEIDFSSIRKIWANNDSESKFKLGEEVINKTDGKKYIINGVNHTGLGGNQDYEYTLAGYPYLVYEYILKGV